MIASVFLEMRPSGGSEFDGSRWPGPQMRMHEAHDRQRKFRRGLYARNYAYLSLVTAKELSAQMMEEKPDMRVYLGSDIRNVAVVGHAHCGKTTLISRSAACRKDDGDPRDGWKTDRR